MNALTYIVRGVLLLLAIILMIIGILTITRATHVNTVIAPGEDNGPPAVTEALFAREMELYTGTRLLNGNRVELLLNGEGTYARLWDDIRAARQSITMQMYYGQAGAIADTVRDLLIDRAKAGVRIAVLLDAFGAAPLRKTDFVEPLRQAGIMVTWLRPIRWYALNRAATRSHSRIVVIDGRIGYTGGFGIADYWQGDGVQDGHWRESNIRFEGPAVAALQAAFAAGWAEATGILLTGPQFFRKESFDSVGSIVGGLLHTVPSVGSTAAERYLALSIAGARKTLYITNSYFVPESDFRNLLKHAVQRGVDVRLLTVGSKTDVKTTWRAGRAYYEELLRAGVRIYEYQPTMMHAKTLVADGLWTSIGSMNFDNRSLAFNNETNFVALDSGLGALMDSVFFHDLERSEEITITEFSRRGWFSKLMEWGAEKLWRIL